MKVLVTGGTGYLGGRIARYLDKKGYKVSITTRSPLKENRFKQSVSIEYIDWDNPGLIEKLCSKYDVILHSAGMNAKDCSENPVKALAFNGRKTEEFASIAAKKNVKKFIYFSTFHVYQAIPSGNISILDTPKNSHPYATSHLEGENAVRRISCRRKSFDAVVLRLTNVVGPPISPKVNCWDLVINDLCKQAVLNNNIVVENPYQKRDFVSLNFLENLTESIINDSFEGKEQVLNISSGKSYSIDEVSKIIIKLCKELKINGVTLSYKNKKNLQLPSFKVIPSIKPAEFNFIDDIRETLIYVKENLKDKNRCAEY